MNADRNLLLGVLALQMDFISRDALIAAMNAWVLRKNTPLGQILLDQGAVQADVHDLLEAMVEKHVEQHGHDPQKSLAAVSSVGSLREDLRRIADPEVEATLVHVAAARDEVDPYATVSPSAGARTSSGLRFTVLRPHAKGGLGKVSVAQDEELHREVAFKEIQESFADDPNSRSRFLLEAEITGGLEHPGIVPVYGLGTYGDGRPYYAMRFIKGDSLKEAIERFHGTAASDGYGTDQGNGEQGTVDGTQRSASNPKSNSPTGEQNPKSCTSLEFRKLLGRFIDVCNAIEYAHSRGVLHRDLKPQNIMLGNYGETLVVDWGLAKIVGHRETLTAADERTLQPSSASGSAPTQMGVTVGTPQYMSPEQAEGRLDKLGPASDVYSLGATLYSLLTGAAPFRDVDAWSIISKVAKGDFDSPRQLNPEVPRLLEAICLKAMALKPTGRYSSPRALADDVEHWLADEPVAALPDSLSCRVSRWARRHRAWAQAAAAALVLVTLVSLLALGLVNAERRATATALVAETSALNRADQALAEETKAKNEAKQAIDRYVQTVEEAELLSDARFQPLRKKLLADALQYYQDFIRAHEHDPARHSELAKALYRVGLISYRTSSADDALAAFLGAAELFKKLAEEYPTRTEYQTSLGDAYHNMGVLQRETGQSDVALASFQQALSLREKLIEENPTVAKYQSDLALTCTNVGHLQRATGLSESALARYEQALSISKKLDEDNPTVTEYQNDLAQCYLNLGLLQSGTAQREAALASYDQAISIQEKMVEENPKVTEYHSDLAQSYNNLGELQRATGEREAAFASHQRALSLRKRLAEENPAVTKYQHGVAESYLNFGLLNSEMDKPETALASYEQALSIHKKLVEENPTVTDYQNDLAQGLLNLGVLQLQMGQRDAASTSFNQVRPIQECLVVAHPELDEYQVVLGRCYFGLGVVELSFQRPEQGLEWFSRADAALTAVVDRDPGHADARILLGKTCWVRAETLASVGRHAEAAVDYRRALELDAGPMQVPFRLGLAYSLARAGDHGAAVAEADELAKQPNLPGDTFYNLACVWSLCSAAAKDDVELTGRYATRAVELLRRLEAMGYFGEAAKVEHMKQDADLEPLREHDDFRRLLEELERAGPVKEGADSNLKRN